MLYTILIIAEVVISLALILLILLQQGKGADAGAAFGSGASGTVFGSKGSASFLARATGVLAFLFMANSTTMAYLSHTQTSPMSVVEKAAVGNATQQAANAPGTPVGKPELKSEGVPPAPAKSSSGASSEPKSAPKNAGDQG